MKSFKLRLIFTVLFGLSVGQLVNSLVINGQFLNYVVVLFLILSILFGYCLYMTFPLNPRFTMLKKLKKIYPDLESFNLIILEEQLDTLINTPNLPSKRKAFLKKVKCHAIYRAAEYRIGREATENEIKQIILDDLLDRYSISKQSQLEKVLRDKRHEFSHKQYTLLNEYNRKIKSK